MLKLIQCEFWKLKRKHFVSFVIFAALLFPIPFTALVLAGSIGNFTGFDAVFGLLVTLGEPVMLPIVLGRKNVLDGTLRNQGNKGIPQFSNRNQNITTKSIL